MSAAGKDRDDEIVELLRAIRQELMVARAPRSGPMTIAMASGVLACSERRVHELMAEGKIKRWPKKVGKHTQLDASSVWAVNDTPAPAPRAERSNRSAAAEAEAARKLKID